MKFTPHEYQSYAIQRVLEQPRVGLFLECGLGKTVVVLTAVEELVYNELEIQKVLVIAPLRVAQTVWDAEANKWDHTRKLRFSKILGDPVERLRALRARADVYVINRENVPWLTQTCGQHWPFDMVVIDELSSFKSAQSQRFKALRQVMPAVQRVVGLTGTPAPNGLIDLWPQVYLLDGGAALGPSITQYRNNYFVPARSNGPIVYTWALRSGAENRIYERLQGTVVSMKAQDHIRMPERIDNVVRVPLNDRARAQYSEMERDMILPLKDQTITAASAAAVVNKLLQITGGAVYDEDGTAHEIHSAKLDALEDIIEAANGHPVLVYYAYKHEAQRIMHRFPAACRLRGPDDVKRWNEGRIPLLLAHPDSAGHGLNLQAGGHILVWYGLTWSLEKYQQANARLHRQGQKTSVIIHHLVCEKTIDEQVMRVLASKDQRQSALMDAVKARIEEVTGGAQAI